MKYAPETPTTQELHEAYPLDPATTSMVAENRAHIGDLLVARRPGLIALAGPCALTGDVEIIRTESESIARISSLGNVTLHGNEYAISQDADKSELAIARRLPPWKPRTKPTGWFGEETTNPVGAYRTLSEEARLNPLALEYGHMPHAERYAPLTSLAWVGARTDDKDFVRRMAEEYPDLPLGVKNGLDGTIDGTLELVQDLRARRGSGDAPVVLIYRGGENAQDPLAWEQQYLEALAATDGQMIVDTAHGSEMAHHPDHADGTFAKSEEGQKDCLEHVIDLAKRGYYPTGIMIEASDAHSPTDPPIPFADAVEGVQRLHTIIKDVA